MRHATTASETLSPEISRRFTERSGLPLREGYGQTETALLLGNPDGFQNTISVLDRPSPQYRVEIRNPEDSPRLWGNP